MAELTARQRAHLKSAAHPLKPILQIGKDGVTDLLVRSVHDAFRTRELFKVRILDTAPSDARDLGQQLVARVADAHLVQVIGRTLVLYRADPDSPGIRLPD